ncbi:MAG: hypothetical protein ACXW2U_10120 [Telluria sp.]
MITLDSLTSLIAERPPLVGLPALTASRQASKAAWALFQEMIKAISVASTLALVSRIQTATDALVLWEIHLELDRRGIAPSFRYPTNAATPQMEFVTWLADLHWFTRQKPKHKPCFDKWQRLFGPITDGWHESARHVFETAYHRGNVATYTSRGMNLAECDRRLLMSVKSTGQLRRLRDLRQADDRRESITMHIAANAGRLSKDRTPDQVARRRFLIWKTYVLADRSETIAARIYQALYGEAIPRQNLGKQIEAVNQAWKEFLRK